MLASFHLKEQEASEVILLISFYYINYNTCISNDVVKMTDNRNCALIGKTEKDLLSLFKKKIFFFVPALVGKTGKHNYHQIYST